MKFKQIIHYRKDICAQQLYGRCEDCNQSWEEIEECEEK